jgi:PAS domain S-box-containing protein
MASKNTEGVAASATPEEASLQTQNLELRREVEELRSYREQQDKGIALYHVITENIADLISVIDGKARRIWNNRAYYETLGYNPEELEETSFFAEIHPDDRQLVENDFKEAQETGIGGKVEYRMRHKNGHWVPLESKATVVRNDHGSVDCIILVARDITDRKRMEEELRQVQKMESVASISRKVANDFNDLITAILGKISMARQLVKKSTPESKLLAEAAEVGDRAQGLIQELLSLTAQNVKATAAVDLHELLPQCVERVVPAGSAVRCELSMPEARIMVQGSAQVLGSAIDQVLRNAVESMGQGGLIRVDLALERVERGGALLKAGLYAAIRIRDQGLGIREEHIRHIFEPYFSTKAGHQGLGLSSALAAASEHGGTLRVYSNTSTGTEAVMYLPATPQEHATRQIAPATSSITNRKRVLVMDDERFVRQFVVALLEQLGYEAVATKDGDELLEEFRTAVRINKPYHAVITDLLVPEGMGGESIPEKLREYDPGVKIIVTSGFSSHPALVRYRDYGFDGALPKPFRADEMKEALKELIGGA